MLSTAIAGEFIAGDDWRPVAVQAVWDDADPLAVRFEFTAEGHPPTVWTVCRQLLFVGLQSTAFRGMGDVKVSCSHGVLWLRLSSSEGLATIRMPSDQVAWLFEEMHACMTVEEESALCAVEIDNLIEELCA